MSTIKMKKVTKRNPREPEAAPKFYLSAIHGEQVGVEQLSTEISNRCTLRRSDVQGVLIALMDIIPDEICKGNIVSLGELGTFYVNVSSSGVENADEVSVSNLKGFKLIHLPTKKFKKHLNMINVSLQSAS
jgi:predicted histone-like DNA-binding protein